MLVKLWTWMFVWLTWGILGIRYRIRLRGLENLKSALSKKGGILFLPNHPAEIDPVMLVASLWPKFRPRPIVVENFYYLAGAHYLQKLIGALPMPDMNGMVNKWKQKKIEKLFHYVSEKLKEGENFLIYPSGRLKTSGNETVGGASFVHNLLKESPEVNIVLIRTTGLWGSRFSRAITGATPDFGKVFLEGMKVVLKNFLFLTPRREVTIDFQVAPSDFPYQGSRLEVNQYLEKWYNISGPEPLKLISDSFWRYKVPAVYEPKEKKEVAEELQISPQQQQEIIAKVAKLTQKTPDQINPNMSLSRDLGLDSLDSAALYVFIEERFEVPELKAGSLETVADALRAAAASSTANKEKKADAPITGIKWPEELARPPVAEPQGKTVQEAFLRICDKMDSYAACADVLYGVMTYRRLKMAALILSKKISKLDGDRIGILLPSSIASYLLIVATLLAKKTPVMLNWTVGTKALDHCTDIAGLKVVLSSRRFLNNLNNGDLGKIDDLLLLLEDLKSEITLREKLAGLYALLKDADTLLEQLDLLNMSPNDPCVILFTSGTEALPKGVPLSHENILSNHKAALSCVDFINRDILYGILPPFHSFGFSVTGLLPLLAGMRVYYAPDPTDAHGMARDIAAWHATIFCCAPTFIKGLFRVAKPSDLDSLRYIVTGAEKAPQELFDHIVSLNEKGGTKKQLIEGYGITECAPIVTLCRPGKEHIGVGQPIPGIELCVIDHETGQVLPQGTEGEICICGLNVFSGYLGTQKSPFLTIEGKPWYRSGDRGYVDSQNNLILSGRLKRFVKIGGEMVSLGGIEEELLRLAADKKWKTDRAHAGPSLAIGVAEAGGDRPLLVLFTTLDITKDEVNMALRESGFGRIVKVAEVRKIDQIPLTGTGKTHYHALDELLKS